MQGDSLSQFLDQGGGAVLRLIMTTVVIGIVWLMAMSLVIWRRNERKRREREGLAPLPNIFAQLWGFIQQTTNPQTGQSRQSATMSPTTMSMQFAQTGGHIPLPDMNDLTGDLPEPDLDFLVGGFDVEPEAPPPLQSAVSQEDLHELVEEDDTYDNDAPMSASEYVGEMPVQSTESEYVPGSNEIPTDAVEVMRVWRDVSDGALIVQMADKVFQSVPEMQDSGKAKRFINIVSDLARVAQVGAQSAGLAPPNFETTSAVISQQGSWAEKKRPPIIASIPIADNPPTVDAIRANQNQEEKKPSGIADQIEELLQFRLMQTPIFQHRSIHVRPHFDGSIRIQVDDYFYENVDEIVDADVREFIQRVIREWEARQ
jgi:hypothetical protein